MSTTLPQVWSAPGKAFLLGEYAVLGGAPALVAAVSCRARAWFDEGARPASALVEEIMRRSGQAERQGSVVIDSAAFRTAGERKLGTGSSAAVAAAATAVLLARAGEDPTTIAGRARLLALADEAHRAWQGGVGSGADVATAVQGGLLRYVRGQHGTGVQDLRPPPGLELVFFAASTSAATTALVAAVQAFATRAPQGHAALMADLTRLAHEGADAGAAGDTAALLRILRAYGVAMDALGRAADVDIVLPPFREAAEAAAGLGGAAKPSGAGGGDIGVAAFRDAAASQNFIHVLPNLGLVPLALGLDLAGTRPDLAASHEKNHD